MGAGPGQVPLQPPSRHPGSPGAASLHLAFARVSAAAGAVQTWTLLAVARPRLPHASRASDASRCGAGEGPGPQENSRKPAGSAGPSATNASPSPPGARASPLPPTRASCQPPHSAAQAAAPISPPDMLAWQAAGPRVTFLLERFREAVSSGSATRRSENPGRAARPSLLQPQL